MERKMLAGMALVAGMVAVESFGAIRALTHDNYGGKTNAWQIVRHNEKLSSLKEFSPKVVFVGDSITHSWERMPQFAKYFSRGDGRMLNLGTSADRTEHVLWRLNEGGELDGYEAKVVFLMIGTNNTGHFPFEKEPPIDTILGIREILRTIRAKQPNALIVLSPIFPRGIDDDDPYRRRNAIVNKEIMKFADGDRILWLDFTDQFLTADGMLSREIFPDLLHPGEWGYEIWYAAVKPYVDYALSDGLLPRPASRYASRIDKSHYRFRESCSVYPKSAIAAYEGLEKWNWVLERMAVKRNEIANSNGAFDLVMVGDSITHYWEREANRGSYSNLVARYSVLNLGYGGNRTENVLWRLANGELEGYKAKCFTILIGTNNGEGTVDSSPDHKPVTEGIKAIVELIQSKHPESKIVLMTLLPRVLRAGEEGVQARNDRVNADIREMADGDRVILLDIASKFVGPDGDMTAYLADHVHPNARGYAEVWLPALLPLLEKVVGR